MIFIVDTNVVVVANNRVADHVSPECVLNCVNSLSEIMKGNKIALDDQNLIISEYRSYSNYEGQPGIGDRFLRWILLNQTTGQVDFVPVHSTPPDTPKKILASFVEFPSDSRLSKFDTSDRVFVAVALTHPEHPPILNAVDTDWRHFQEALEENEIKVEFLCPDDIQRFL